MDPVFAGFKVHSLEEKNFHRKIMKIIVRTFHKREFEMLDLDISGKWF